MEDNKQGQAPQDGGQGSPADDVKATAGQVSDLPAWAQDLVKDLRRESAARRKRETELEAAQKASDEEKLAGERKWQELADKRKAELDALTPRVALADKLAQMMTGQLEAEIKAWPEEVRALDPGADDLVSRMAWAEKARGLAAKLVETAKSPKPGNAPGPKPAGQPPAQQAQRQPLRL